MTTTFETSIKISFDFTLAELQELYCALNSAEVAIMHKRDDEKRSFADRKYFESVSVTLEEFVSNFNPARFLNA